MSDGHAEGDEPASVGPARSNRRPRGPISFRRELLHALLTSALAEREPVAMLLLRRLCPRAVYPGRARVGNGAS